MKNFFYFLAAAATLAACSGNSGYTVKGSVEGATDGDVIYLQKVQGRNLVKLDSTTIKNGAFSFSGKQDTTVYRYLTYKNGNDNGLAMDFFLENGNIQVEMSQKNKAATGTPNNDAYQQIRTQMNDIMTQMEATYASLSDTTLTDEQREAKSRDLQSFEDKIMKASKDAINQHINNPVGVQMLKQNFYYMSLDELDPLMDKIPATFDNDEVVIRIKESVAKMKKTAVGQKFTDFTMQTPDGKDVKLSDFVGKGKVVLVDFWASWCGPCRREMPNLVEAYKKYKNKNFEIIGVSLDRNNADWKRAIKDLNITWPQMSDLKFWNCEGAKLYAVSSIPHVILIDGEGTIIARGLHGEELQQKLAEVLK